MTDLMQPLVRIIDDEVSVRNSEKFIFAIINVDAVAYESAEEFLEKDDLMRPGCIVLDLRMDGMSGLELQQVLQEKKCDLPIVFLSGHGTINTAVFALKRGASDFLEKPVKPEKLQNIVKALIARNLLERRKQSDISAMKDRFESLTEREKDVIRLVAKGEQNKRVAGMLGIAEQTVKIHRGNAFHKLQLRSAVDAYAMLQAIGEMLETGNDER